MSGAVSVAATTKLSPLKEQFMSADKSASSQLAMPTGLGGLAQIIATRGGTAAPEMPFVIEHREALIYMLCQAAELEHGIMCQYLFAAFSLKQRTDEGLTETELEAVNRWQRQISHVATQEMLHLALVHNLLSAIGAAPHLARPNLPQPANHYPAGVQLALLPFGEQALRHFMFLERPEGMALDDADGLAAVGQAEPLMAADDIVPRLQDFATVGHLYRSIEHGLARLAEKFGERWLFVGPPRAQATSENFRWPELVAVTDLASARRAVEEILEQGEGARGHWENAHFGQFVKILDEYRAMREANPLFDPVRPVVAVNVRPSEHGDVPVITDALTARCTDLFNVAYEILLQTLERYFAHTEETDAQLATLADLTLGLMFQVIKPVGELITTLPAGPEYPGRTAGPSFELFYESDYLMPHQEAAWALLEERLREAADYSERVRAEALPPVSEGLTPIGPALNELADSLAAHFPEWGRRSRWARDEQPMSAAPTAGPTADALVARADELVKAARHSGRGDATTHALASLLADVHALTMTAASAGVETTSLARLVDSAMRPLTDTVASSADDADAADAQPATGVGPSESFADQLWAVTKAATRLGATPNAALGLIEATAALQDLACELAPPADVASKLAELRNLQAAVPSGIQVSPDGPYLVTNAENVRSWLGDELPARPQMALCRCGESQRKPFCDGTHARIGFSGAKDPKRVPDHRDTYSGQQVTIFDNRGICQHSGYCTDRLSSVFHADADPFVTPSGGRLDDIIRAVRNCPSGALSYAIDDVEARAAVDHHSRREPTIEVSKDGPYRVTGGIPLTDENGADEPRAEGSSREHYALCRCGHSQNKPFCSGMHWYVDFKDPQLGIGGQPSLFEWAGGLPALTTLSRLFYEKHVPGDPLLAPLFATMPSDQAERAAAWLAEAFGGPNLYSQRFGDGQGGSSRLITQGASTELTTPARARWISLMHQCADEAGLPGDAEFRSAFASYIQWDSAASAKPAAGEKAQVPQWNWGAAGPPVAAATASEDSQQPSSLPGPDETVSFSRHIKALFRTRDRQSMSFAFDLWSYADVTTNANAILERLQSGSMPCDGAWSPDRVQAFQRWVDAGMPE
jgi:CDGSH-type Zn-finger protein/truncated hemoglobin YjbI